jgi:hypothetical protein
MNYNRFAGWGLLGHVSAVARIVVVWSDEMGFDPTDAPLRFRDIASGDIQTLSPDRRWMMLPILSDLPWQDFRVSDGRKGLFSLAGFDDITWQNRV